MKKLIIAIVAIALIGAGTVAALSMTRQAETTTATHTNKLLFNDEFDGTALDTSKWVTCYDNYVEKYQGCTNLGNDEDEWYLGSQLAVKGGRLVLTADRKDTTGRDRYGNEKTFDFRSAMISSGSLANDQTQKWIGRYGYYEARMFVPSGQAIWPAFWLLSANRQWPPEIDVMEYIGQDPTKVLATYHWKNQTGDAQLDSSNVDINTDLSKNWHVYAVDWRAGSLTWYVDGKEIKRSEGANVPDQDMQIILNLAVGGNLPGKQDATTPNQSQLLVDYVRVYEN